ncbi:FecR family protein [Pedobacter lusitanus]|uniref:FecR family protein n=1 Tax=Pedobacter lusitanus TaxID=1503925 RepID=UPI000696E305|nr:FecR domain-containing protein [Pedobacter lusitanus]
MQLPENDFLIEDLICNEDFQHYCLGASLENHILWEDWIHSLPERASDIATAKKLVNILTVKQGSRLKQVKALKDGFKQKEALNLLLNPVSENKPLYKSSANFYKYIGYTAAAIVLLVSGYFIQQAYLSSKDIRPTVSLAASVFSSDPEHRRTLVLTDGTVITLNKNSEIRFTGNFNPAKRELWLKGEAFFEVKHDPVHPFTVHTAMNEIKVLGTSFNVKAYAGSRVTETSLIHGRVQVASTKYPGYKVLLKPNEKLSYDNTATNKNLKNIFQVSSFTGGYQDHVPAEIRWVRNRMIIDNESLAVIAGKLKNWYGIEIYIASNEVKDYRYSGTFENESLIKTLEALQMAYPFEFRTEQNKIIITK